MSDLERQRRFFVVVMLVGAGLMILSFFLRRLSYTAFGWTLSFGFVLYLIAVIWAETNKEARPPGYWPYKGKWKKELVSSQQAAKRAICLGAFTSRGHFEVAFLQMNPAERDAAFQQSSNAMRDLNRWLRDEGHWDALSNRERALLEKPPGKWEIKDCIGCSGEREALAVILWALGQSHAIEPYDQETDQTDVVRLVGLLTPSQRFLRRAVLRSEVEIRKALDVAGLWVWRAFITYMQKHPEQYPAPKDITYQQIIANVVEEAEKAGSLHGIDGDFTVFGKAYSQLSQEEWERLSWIASQRAHALGWLCGYAEDWDVVPTAT